MNINDNNKPKIIKEKNLPPSYDSEQKNENHSNSIQCFGGTVNHIKGIKLKMMNLSMKKENVPDAEQEKKASIHLPDQGIINIGEGDLIDLNEQFQLQTKEIMPYTMETNGYVIFTLLERSSK